jgi:hypothetical protein
MGFGNIGATINSLVQLGISEALAAELRSYLTTTAGELTDSTPDGVGTNAFGQAPASVQCASDAAKARTHVANALKDMAAALEGYGTIVTELYHDVNTVDETAEQDFRTKAAQANACVPVSFAAPSSCTLPGASGEGE